MKNKSIKISALLNTNFGQIIFIVIPGIFVYVSLMTIDFTFLKEIFIDNYPFIVSIGTIGIFLLFNEIRKWAVKKYLQKANQSEIEQMILEREDFLKYHHDLVKLLNKNREATDRIPRDITTAKDFEDLKNRFGGVKYIYEYYNDFKPNEIKE